MPLRLMEVTIPEYNNDDLRKEIEGETTIDYWQEEVIKSGLWVKMILSVEQTEKILDLLEKKYSNMKGFRVVLLPVEATLPRIEEQNNGNGSEENKEQNNNALRISREELYTDIVDSTKVTTTYIAMVILSAVVASVGLLQDNVAVVIGAMVIAPLLGPNVALALATTLGDSDLGYNALRTSLIGVLLALAFSILAGFVLHVDPETNQISSRLNVGLSDIVLALASGAAGVLAFTSGASISLIGVMVAVALMPPLITFGLLIGAGHFPEAVGALLLLVTNIICVNLAGVTTFLAQGIRPRRWWEASKAKKASRLAITIWSILLAILIAVILISQSS